MLALQERFLQQERMGTLGTYFGQRDHQQQQVGASAPEQQVNRRKNYIIFEQNDEDTLI